MRIAMSGRSGCGNSTTSKMLADRLNIRLINYTFRTLAEENGVSFEQMSNMAEADDSWDRRLDQEQVQRAQQGPCVLGSRLAIWLLRPATLTVYLTASLPVRATRIANREGRDVETVTVETAQRDRRDHARYLRLYSIDTASYEFADVIVDTERYNPEQIVSLIVEELRARGEAGA